MYILRALGVFVSTVFYGLISLFISFSDPDGRRQNTVAQRWARSLLSIAGVKVEAEGLEKIDPNGSYVIASNHLSYFDTPVMLATIPAQFRFMAKYGLFKIPLLGTHLSRAGHIPVFRHDPRSAVKTLAMAAEAIREKHISVLIFPEGGRSEDSHIQPFKDGAAYIAIRAGVPVLPVALWGTWDVLPFGGGKIRPANVRLRVGEPIDTSSAKLKQRGEVTEQVRQQIVSLLGEHV